MVFSLKIEFARDEGTSAAALPAVRDMFLRFSFLFLLSLFLSSYLSFLAIRNHNFYCLQAHNRSHRRLGSCLLRRHVSCVPVGPVGAVLTVALLVLAAGRLPRAASHLPDRLLTQRSSTLG